MTALSSPPISPQSPLNTALQARTMRPSRADPAPSFEQILSDKTDPATQQAADEAQSEQEAQPEDAAPAEDSAEGDANDPDAEENPDKQANAVHGLRLQVPTS